MWFADFPWADTGAVILAFAVGAMLGSFLNVVAHRVPAGESVVWGGSRCPHCRSPVRPVDNVPIIAWCLLRGRCRDCRGPISARYPAIEAVCACALAAVTAADLTAGGGMDGILAGHEWRTPWLIVLHAGLVITLVAWGLLAAAGHPIGGRTFLTVFLIAAAGVAVLAVPDGPWPHPTNGWQEWTRQIAPPGSVVARMLGAMLAWLAGRRLGCPGTGESLAVAAAVCGWKAVPILTVVTLVSQWVGGRPRLTGRADAAATISTVVRAVSVPLAVVTAVAAGLGQG